MTRRTALWFFVTALAATLFGGAAWADNLLIPKGTVLPVALIQDISTATVKVGDKIKAVYTGDDEGGFPTGTVFVGTVTEASARQKRICVCKEKRTQRTGPRLRCDNGSAFIFVPAGAKTDPNGFTVATASLRWKYPALGAIPTIL